MKKKWTKEEVKYLKESWDTETFKNIKERLDRSDDSIMRKARRLGLNMYKKEDDLMKRKWRPEEDKFVIENYKKMSSDKIASHINRTASSIRKRARALSLSSVATRWDIEEEQFLFEKWGIINAEAIAKHLNRSRNAILLKAYQMSLREQVTANGTYLTPKDISIILNVNIRTLYSWMWHGLIRYRRFRVGRKTKYQITVEAFCGFIKSCQNKWDSKEADIDLIRAYCCSYYIYEDGTLAFKEKSTRWLEEKIMRDKLEYRKVMKPWTTNEEKELSRMLADGYSHKEICIKLGRSIGSTKTKIYTLKNKTGSQLNLECNYL